MTTLDDLKQIKKIDKSGMGGFIAGLPDQCLRAYQLAQKLKLPKDYQNINNIVVCGMGGSGIGGDLTKIMVNNQLSTPLIISRDWDIHQIIDKQTLVILISYSGETQETLSCAEQAIKNGAKNIIITGGGRLKKLARKEKIPALEFDRSGPPRANLGYTFMPILVVLEKLNLVDLKKIQAPVCLKELKEFNQIFYPETPTEKNIAKYLAYFIFDHLPVVIVPEKLAGIGRRWKTQLAENSKNFAFFETRPEIFHNFIESQIPWRLRDEFVFLILENFEKETLSEQSLTKFEDWLDKNCIKWEKIPCFGKNPLTQTLSLVLLGDWVSFYLAILNNVDPTPVEQIQKIKNIKT